MDRVNQAAPPQDRIVEAARRLVAEFGLAGVTMTAVAREAGVARQTLYNHFPNVESIVTTVIEQHERLGLTQVRRLLAGHEGASAKLEQLIRHSVTMGAHGHGWAVLESSLSPRAQVILGEHRSQAKAMVVEILHEGVEEGVFGPDLDVETYAIFIQDILVSGSNRDAAIDMSRLAGAAVRFVLTAVGASSS